MVSDSEISSSESLVKNTGDLPPVSFNGDLFGSAADYSNDNFGQIDGDGVDDAEADGNKEDEDQRRLDYELEMCWEHDRANQSFSGSGMEIDLDDKSDDEDHTSTFDSLASLQNSASMNLQVRLFDIHPNIPIHELAL